VPNQELSGRAVAARRRRSARSAELKDRAPGPRARGHKPRAQASRRTRGGAGSEVPGRPGEERSKWRPPAELMSPRLRRLEKAQRTFLEYYELPHSPNHIEWLRRLAPQIGIASHPNATVRGE